MTHFKVFFLFCFFASQVILGQNDSITRLREVIVSDVKLRKFSSTQTIISLNDSILSKNTGLLTNSLNYNTVLYFKEYGRGMLSTVAFRGTTSSQTAVIWNGININSQMNGSTDFNTLTSNDYNSVQVKGGGGSVIYGSGAIGGTLHLGTNLSFTDVISNEIRYDYGSFNTQNLLYKGIFSNNKWSTQFGFSRNSSANNYKFQDSYDWRGNQRFNENGDYEVNTLNATVGYKFNEKQYLKLYSQSSNTDRNISLLSSSESRTKYKNDFSRNLLEYQASFNKWTTYLRTAYITEGYQYFEDNTKPDYSFGNTNTWIVKADVNHQFNSKLLINALLEYNLTKGEGSGFGNHEREISSFAVLAKYEATKNWQNEFGIRKEITNNYQSPVLFSLGSSWHGISWYQIKANVSHNFRIPTYNDLYWESGGNPNLKPESAYQGELANIFKYHNVSLTQTVYFNKIKDLLRWVPGNNGVWAPQNTDRVKAYGVEVLLNWNKNIGQSHWQLNSTYAYTISQNEETQKQLFFVPFHKATTSLAYSYKKWNVNYQVLYNGFVYTQADNNPAAVIPAYTVSNTSVDYDLPILNNIKIGAQVLNIWGHKYVSLEQRIMPGRNFNMYIIFKF
ncbi:TonB-dependent siderophore receptor [Flavobacterium sp. FPG59]|uniref:TonB-dependent receptor plug domain-containing protein n=1 Tax=Flavobacterium sp. FPG59 TaxID=1929267 RepID=UPI000A39B4E2|nr:TonB-dependent receptor [Flavobacterium sp. FPG59]OUD36497.1 TonB-dependent receptor [Flavobacterium sp. FPG59]